MADLADPIAMHDVRRDLGLGRIPVQELTYPGHAGAMEAKFRIAEVLDVPINSVDRFRDSPAWARPDDATGGARVKRNLHAGGLRSRGLSVNVFTEAELDDIHLATLEVLERTGIFVEDDEALDIFKDGGCRVDREHARRAHPAARRGGRDPLRAEPVRALRSRPEERLRHGAGSRGLHQLQRGHQRRSTWRPASTATPRWRTSPTSPASTTTCSEFDTHEIAVGAKDVPPATAAVHNTEAQLLNTTKPIGIGPLSGIECQAILRMCAEVAGGDDELRAPPHRVRRASAR